MKKIISGIAFLFFGIMIYLTIRNQALNYIPQVTEWSTEKGRWWASLNEINGLMPTYIGMAFCVFGVVMIFWGNFEDGIKKVFTNNKIGKRD